MKKLSLMVSLVLCAYASHAQIVSVKGNKVEVRNEKGDYISSNDYSNLNDALGGDGIVVLWFNNDKVEVRDQKLGYIASNSYSSLKNVRASGKNVVLTFNSGKIEVRDTKLNYISSR